MRIIDAHHHLWDPDVLNYALLSELPQLAPLRRPYTAEHFAAVAKASGIASSVCVEAASAGADGPTEGAWLLGQVRRLPSDSRVVMWAPVESQSVRDILTQLQVAAGVRLAGIRRSFEFTPNGFATSAEVVAGVRAVGECGLPFDLVLFAERLPEVTELVRRCPGVSFVLDHLGKPSIRDGRLDPWRTDFAALARFPNVVCKVSGLVTEASPDGWTPESLRPYVSHAVDCFGWTRLMFGSDWPVCELAGGYRRWLDAVMELTSDASDVDRESFFGANAARTYAGVIAG